MMPFRSLNMTPFTQAAPSTGPIPPPILHTMSTTAGVTQGFPRIGVDLTASRPPPHRFPASGLEPWEGETARKEDKRQRNFNSPGLVGWVIKGGEKKQKTEPTWNNVGETTAAGTCNSGLGLFEWKQARCASSHNSIRLHNVSSSI